MALPVVPPNPAVEVRTELTPPNGVVCVEHRPSGRSLSLGVQSLHWAPLHGHS